MNEKLSFQNISDALSSRANVSKKVSETFTKAFFDTVVDALYMGEETIKIKGLGTFKLVEVENRESVNVSNGERILIPGYKKVSFTTEDSVLERLNATAKEEDAVEDERAEEAADAAVAEEIAPAGDVTPVQVASAELSEERSSATADTLSESVTSDQSENRVADVLQETAPDDVDALIQVPEPQQVEILPDEFAGIDMLISTPESVDEVRTQFEEAKSRLDAMVAEARKINTEKVRLEKLLARLEANVTPEMPQTANAESEVQEAVAEVAAAEESLAEEQAESVAPAEAPVEEVTPAATSTAKDDPAPVPADDDKRQEAFNRFMQEQHDEAASTQSEPVRRNWWRITLVTLLVALLVGVIVFFLYRTSLSIEEVEKVPPVEQPKATPAKRNMGKPAKKVAPALSAKDSLDKASVKPADAKKDTVKLPLPQVTEAAKPEKPVAPARPKTHKVQKGESLTRISQRYYGTKDSVRAIIRANTFANPDNVPEGAVIKLP